MRKTLYSVCFLFALVFIACSDDNTNSPEPTPTNEIIKANFSVKQGFNYWNNDTFTWLENDTIVFGHHITLSASGSPENSYEWQVENDTNKLLGKEKNYNPKATGVLKIRLIVKANPNKPNHEGDVGIDTAYKTIYILEAKKMSVLGEYTGSDTINPSVTYKVKISIGDNNEGLTIENIDKGFTAPDHAFQSTGLFDISNKVVSFDYFKFTNGGTNNPKGFAELQTDGKTIIINYESGEASNRKKHKFIGVKN